MKTVEVHFDGVLLLVPVVGGVPLPFPADTFADFDTYCGPGKLGDKLVPDKLYGTPINVACFIHDVMFDLALPTWAEFHQCNSVFLHNIIQILDYFDLKDGASSLQKSKYNRYYSAVTYYMFVDSGGGPRSFWKLKKEQEFI